MALWTFAPGNWGQVRDQLLQLNKLLLGRRMAVVAGACPPPASCWSGQGRMSMSSSPACTVPAPAGSGICARQHGAPLGPGLSGDREGGVEVLGSSTRGAIVACQSQHQMP